MVAPRRRTGHARGQANLGFNVRDRTGRRAGRCGQALRIISEAVRRMREQTPRARGDRLVDALLAWVAPDRPLRRELNRFQVRVSDDGGAWIERLRW